YRLSNDSGCGGPVASHVESARFPRIKDLGRSALLPPSPLEPGGFLTECMAPSISGRPGRLPKLWDVGESWRLSKRFVEQHRRVPAIDVVREACHHVLPRPRMVVCSITVPVEVRVAVVKRRLGA